MRRKTRDGKRAKHDARRERVVRRLAGSSRPRLTVFRSARHTYAQIDDLESGRTLCSVSTRSKAVADGLASTGNVDGARRVGAAIAALAREKQIDEVVFNRNGFLYHGRVKAVADAAREAGLRF
jgi:large subunit ribosomal protein L18